jgi:hypothetical protein
MYAFAQQKIYGMTLSPVPGGSALLVGDTAGFVVKMSTAASVDSAPGINAHIGGLDADQSFIGSGLPLPPPENWTNNAPLGYSVPVGERVLVQLNPTGQGVPKGITKGIPVASDFALNNNFARSDVYTPPNPDPLPPGAASATIPTLPLGSWPPLGSMVNTNRLFAGIGSANTLSIDLIAETLLTSATHGTISNGIADWTVTGKFSVVSENPNARVGVSLVDMGTGLWSVVGILAALAQRKDSGEGARVDTSLMETGMAWMTNPIANYSASGKLPKRMGSATAMLAPYEVFETADAHVFIGCGADRMFQKMAAALGQPGMAQDERFATNAARVANRDVLHRDLEAITCAQSTDAIVDTLRAAGVPVSAVNDLSKLLNEPQVLALGLHQDLSVQSDSGASTILAAIGTPIRFNGERFYNGHLSARVGQDTDTVLAVSNQPDPTA